MYCVVGVRGGYAFCCGVRSVVVVVLVCFLVAWVTVLRGF